MSDLDRSTGAAADIGRFAFFLGQYPLTARDRSAVLTALPLWWSAGHRGLARLRGSFAQRSGIVTHATALAVVLRRLEGHNIVQERPKLGTHVYDLLEVARWRWSDEDLARAGEAWRAATFGAGWEEAEAMDVLRSVVDRLPDHVWIGSRRGRPVFHPDDRASREWADQLAGLAREYGRDVLLDALRELARDPSALPQWSPKVLRDTAWAFAIRARSAP